MTHAEQKAPRALAPELPDDFVSRSDGLRFRASDEGSRTATFVASTDALDSYDERVVQHWALERYQRNPIVLFAHDRHALPVGQCIAVAVVDGQLECTLKFATAEANPLAEQVWQSIQQKTLRAVSVGFRPHTYRYEMENDQEVLVLDDNELYEISVVPLPANPDALAKMKQRAVRAPNDTKPSPPAPETNPMSEALQKALDKANTDLAEREADVRAVEKTLAETRATLETVREEHTKAVAERDAALKSAGETNDKLVELEVGALIGKKIAPVEKDSFVKLRKADKALFDDMISKRQPMRLDEQIVPAATTKASPGADDLGDLVDGIEKSARN